MRSSFKFKTAAIVMAFSTLALAGCQSTSEPKTSSKEDPCGASQYKHLIGSSAKNLDMTKFPAGTRLLYPTTPMTRDYRIDRLNIHADKTGNIIRVECN